MLDEQPTCAPPARVSVKPENPLWLDKRDPMTSEAGGRGKESLTVSPNRSVTALLPIMGVILVAVRCPCVRGAGRHHALRDWRIHRRRSRDDFGSAHHGVAG